MSITSFRKSPRFPGDEFIPRPKKIVTHSITINAPPAIVWPWLIQMGSGRAGWYSYDRIDNGGRQSAGRIIPALQHIEVGDIMPAVPDSKDAFIVREVKAGENIILVVPIQNAIEDADAKRRMLTPLRVSWALILETMDPGKTRLISRGRISTNWLAPPGTGPALRKPIFIERVYRLLGKIPWWLMQPIALTGHYIMESHMLRGIKRRAESKARSQRL